MKEIKFRAWDKKEKKMTTSFVIFADGKIEDTSGGDVGLGETEFSPVMQYTGLNDKNGKEMFEGDIVISIDDEKRIPITIDWHTAKATFCLNKNGWMFAHFFGEAGESDSFEVIGNIYENPDLLK